MKHWFPHCTAACVVVVPGPGMPPLELPVVGDALDAAGIADEWTSAGGGVWEPEE